MGPHWGMDLIFGSFMDMNFLFDVVPALGAVLITSLLLIQKAPKWGFLDLPENRKVHLVPTPRTGGIAIALGLLLCLATPAARKSLQGIPWQTWGAGFGFTLLGALDDRFSYHPRRKILWMILLAALAAWPWAVEAHTTLVQLPGVKQGFIVPSFLVFALVLLWFTAVPNAVNIEDAINGHIGGYGAVVAVAVLYKGVDSGLLLGGILAFLVLNWPRARHFLGDAGSFGLGFLIAEMILRAGGLKDPVFALIMTAPISLDVAMGLIRRRRLGMRSFDPDRGTCPHRLLALAGSPTYASPILWSNALILAVLTHWPLGALVWCLIYTGGLVWMNRLPLFRGWDPMGVDRRNART